MQSTNRRDLFSWKQKRVGEGSKRSGVIVDKAIGIIRSIARGLMYIGLILALLTAGLYLWAFIAADNSQLARLLVWQKSSIFGESSYDDWKRVPNRPFVAGSGPVYFAQGDPDIVAELTIDDKPLAVHLEESNSTALIILHGNELLYEGYFNGANRESIQTSFSVAKSFATTLVGIAIDEGYISSFDDPVTRYIPELKDRDPRFQRISYSFKS